MCERGGLFLIPFRTTKKGHSDGCPLFGGERVLAVAMLPLSPIAFICLKNVFVGDSEPDD